MVDISPSQVMDVGVGGAQSVKGWLTSGEQSSAVQRKLTVPLHLEVRC